MRMIRARFQFGMELTADKPRMQIFFQLDNLNKAVVGQNSCDNHAVFAENFSELVVELETVAVTFADLTDNITDAVIITDGK